MLPGVGGAPGRGLADTLREASGLFPDPARGTLAPVSGLVEPESSRFDPDLMLR